MTVKVSKTATVILMEVDHEDLDLYNIDMHYNRAKDLSALNNGKPVVVYTPNRSVFIVVGDSKGRGSIERSVILDLLLEDL